MKSPLGPIEKETVCRCVCVCYESKRKRKTEGVMLAVFFNIGINHKPSPDASFFFLFQHVLKRETLEG